MTDPGAAVLLAFAAGLTGAGIVLFRMDADARRSMDADAEKTYRAIRRGLLEPALLSIIKSGRGLHKAGSLFKDPDVVETLDRYRRELFEYNEANGRRGAASAFAGLAYGMSFLASAAAYTAAGLAWLAPDMIRPPAPIPGAAEAALSVAAVCMAIAAYAALRSRAEEAAFRREMRAIGSRLP